MTLLAVVCAYVALALLAGVGLVARLVWPLADAKHAAGILRARKRRRRPHRHEWDTTHTNAYMLPTRQVCTRCGVSRQVVGVPAVTRGVRHHNMWWLQSDGEAYHDRRVFNHLPDDHLTATKGG